MKAEIFQSASRPSKAFLGVFFLGGFLSLSAQESAIEKAATSGKIKIIRTKTETPSGSPDLLFFKNGAIVEAWNLNLSKNIISFVSQDRNGRWSRESQPRSKLLTIRINQTMEEHIKLEEESRKKPEPVEITSAKHQPIQRRDIISGKFFARQGKYTWWTFKFISELNKFYEHSEEATEYGQFQIRSHYIKPDGKGGVYENEVIARGRYFLYSPGSMGNKDWVLNLTKATYIENDISPRVAFITERLSDEVLIVKFSKDRRSFNLEWANYSGWQWTSPIQQTYYRADRTPMNVGSVLNESDPSIQPKVAVSAVSFLPPHLRRQ